MSLRQLLVLIAASAIGTPVIAVLSRQLSLVEFLFVFSVLFIVVAAILVYVFVVQLGDDPPPLQRRPD